MFNKGNFYKTKNGSKIVCEFISDNDGHSLMKVISGGHGVYNRAGESVNGCYFVTSEGEYNHNPIMDPNYLTDILHGMDVIGPWEEAPKLTLVFETTYQRDAFLTWFLAAGGDQDMRAFYSEHYPECPNLASYDKDSKTIKLFHKGE